MRTLFILALFSLATSLQAQTDLPRISIRIFQETYDVEVWSLDGVTFSGKLTCHTQRYYDHKTQAKRDKKNKPADYYSKTRYLDGSEAKRIYSLYLQSGVDTFLFTNDQVSLSGGKGCLGAVYTVTTFHGCIRYESKYDSFNFRNDSSGIRQIDRIENFLDEAYAELNIDELNNELIDTLPPGTYCVGGIMLMQIPRVGSGYRDDPFQWTMDMWYY